MDHEIDFSFSKPYIAAGEQVLWRGTPGNGNIVTRNDILMIPFSIIWCGFAIFWETSVLLTDAPFFFKLWGIPFVCVGLYLVFGRFLWTAYIRKRTAYVITNQKIIRKRGDRIDILSLANAPATHVEIHKEGYGTIAFGNLRYHTRYNNNLNGYNSQIFTLENIPNVVQVQQIIINAQQ